MRNDIKINSALNVNNATTAYGKLVHVRDGDFDFYDDKLRINQFIIDTELCYDRFKIPEIHHLTLMTRNLCNIDIVETNQMEYMHVIDFETL